MSKILVNVMTFFYAVSLISKVLFNVHISAYTIYIVATVFSICVLSEVVLVGLFFECVY